MTLYDMAALVDTMRNLLAVVVHAANIYDIKPGILATRDAFKKYPSIQQFCADAGYCKSFEQNISRKLGLGVDISAHIKPKWEVLPTPGLLNVPWRGSTFPADFPKIMRFLFALPRLFV